MSGLSGAPLATIMGSAPRLSDVIGRAVADQGGFWLTNDANLLVNGASPPNLLSWTPTKVNGSFGVWNTTPVFMPDVSSALGFPSLSFAGGTVLNGDAVQSNAAAAAFKDFHGPGGCTCFVVARWTGGGTLGHLLDTGGANIGTVGIDLYLNGGSNSFTVLVSNGSGVTYPIAVSIPTSVSNLHVYEFTFSEADGYLAQVDGGEPVIGSIAAALSTSNPQGAAMLGSFANAASVQYLFGDIVDIVLLKGVATQGTRNAIRQGLAAKSTISLGTSPLEPNTPATDMTSDPRFTLP